MSKTLFAVLVLSLLFSQSAGLHYHAYHDESHTFTSTHADLRAPHHAVTLHADESTHEVMAEFETFGPLTLKGSSGLDIPYLFAAVLLLAWLVLGRAMLWQPAPPWKPKPAYRHLRPPLRAPPH